MKNARSVLVMLSTLLLCITACSSQTEQIETVSTEASQEETGMAENDLVIDEESTDLPMVIPGVTSMVETYQAIGMKRIRRFIRIW